MSQVKFNHIDFPVLVVDIAGYTEKYKNENEKREVKRTLNGKRKEIFGEALVWHDTGDGGYLFLDGETVLQALEFTFRFLSEIRSYNQEHGSDLPLHLRVVLAYGRVEVSTEDPPQYSGDVMEDSVRLLDDKEFKEFQKGSGECFAFCTDSIIHSKLTGSYKQLAWKRSAVRDKHGKEHIGYLLEDSDFPISQTPDPSVRSQVIFAIDFDAKVEHQEMEYHLSPSETLPKLLRLSDFGNTPDRLGNSGNPAHSIDWNAAVCLIDNMLKNASQLELPAPVERCVCGTAPLGLFAYLGVRLDSLTDHPVFINRRKTGEWDVLRSDIRPKSEETYFDIHQKKSSDGDGYLAVCISSMGPVILRERVREFFDAADLRFLDMLELRTEENKFVDRGNCSQVFRELAALFQHIPGAYPHREGLVVFLAGAAPLAFFCGRTISPRVFPKILFPHYESGRYMPGVVVV